MASRGYGARRCIWSVTHHVCQCLCSVKRSGFWLVGAAWSLRGQKGRSLRAARARRENDAGLSARCRPGSWRARGKARRSVSVLYKVISRHGLCACRPRVGQCRPGLRKPRLSGGLCGAPSRKTRCSSAYVPRTNFRSPRGVE